MRSENLQIVRYTSSKIAKILSILLEILSAELHGDGSFYTASRINAILAHCTK